MATFTYTPDFGGSENSRPRVRKAELGDGYEHRLTFGLNHDMKEWDLTFGNRSNTETADIKAFLEARRGVESFTWTPPTPGAAVGQYVCEEWQITMNAHNINTVRAKFRQVPEPS